MSNREPLHKDTFPIRLYDRDVAEMDEWRRNQPDLPSRSKAIRELVRLGLKASKRQRATDR